MCIVVLAAYRLIGLSAIKLMILCKYIIDIPDIPDILTWPHQLILILKLILKMQI
jgi:hypothetical protein